jgi:excisionase family DNA binding protein
MISLKSAAARLGISRRTLQDIVKARRIPGARLLNGRWLLPDDFTITPGTRGPKRQ